MKTIGYVAVVTLFLIGLFTIDRIVIARYAHTRQNQLPLLPIYTAETLAEYDGANPNKPVLLAYDGYVYDVSAGRESFYNPGKPYHDLVGKDSSNLLHLAGGGIIAKKYSIVGIYQ